VKHFFSKLIPPRTTFPGDMTPVEAKFMQQHADYWRALVNQDRAIVLGPVMDPAGAYGIGVIKAQLGFRVDLHPMPSVLVKS